MKCESLPQGDLLRTPGDSAEIITRSLEAKPDADVGRGSVWHIGNLNHFDEGGISFAMGRKQAITVQQFDDITHDFMEEEAMRAPFTLGVFDPQLQICGVIRKSGVSQNATEISGKLAALLNAAPFARQANSKILVEPIPDPVGFLQAIRSARAVLRFSFTVSRPNPMDVDRLIQGPAKDFTEKVDGEKSRVETDGPELNKDVIEDVAGAVAADGEQAVATIRPSEGGPSKRVHLAGNPIVEGVDVAPNSSALVAILEASRRAYRRVRGSTQQ